LEYADQYYNLKEFPSGDTKNALIREDNKRLGRPESSQPQAGKRKPRKGKKKQQELRKAAYDQRSIKSGSHNGTQNSNTNNSKTHTPTPIKKSDYSK
jgi:hypothetical protein